MVNACPIYEYDGLRFCSDLAPFVASRKLWSSGRRIVEAVGQGDQPEMAGLDASAYFENPAKSTDRTDG